MHFRTVQTILFATLLGLAFGAAAYPTTSRSGTTTVTGVYRPLDLNLQLDTTLAEPGQLFYDPTRPTNQTLGFTGKMVGTFTSSYVGGAAGDAGIWTLNLGFNAFNNTNYIRSGSSGSYTSSPILDSTVFDKEHGSNTIELRITGPDRPVGTLVYQSGLTATSGTLPSEDTPAAGDMFLLYAHNAGKVLSVEVEGSITNPTNFYLELAQSLSHLGPYVKVDQIPVEIGEVTVMRDRYALDDGSLTGQTRVNAQCTTEGRPGCGSVPERSFFASSIENDTIRVPEPASALLVGLGLLGLAAVRRRLI